MTRVISARLTLMLIAVVFSTVAMAQTPAAPAQAPAAAPAPQALTYEMASR